MDRLIGFLTRENEFDLQVCPFCKLEIGNGSFSTQEIESTLMAQGRTEQQGMGTGKQQEKIVLLPVILDRLGLKRRWFSIGDVHLMVNALTG